MNDITPGMPQGPKGDRGAKGNQGNRGQRGVEGPPADQTELAGLATALQELAQAASSLATSNERMATNFIDYSRDNARRVKSIRVMVGVMIGLTVISLWGLWDVHTNQNTNAEVLLAIENATNPNSVTSKAAQGRLTVEINGLIGCLENHSNRVTEEVRGLPIEALQAGCPPDVLPKVLQP